MEVRQTPHPLDVYCGGGSAKSVGLHGGGVGLVATSVGLLLVFSAGMKKGINRV